MKEFVEKLIGRLENRIKYNELCHKEFPNAKMNFTYEVQINAYKNAIEIANQLAEEYKGKLVSADEVGYMLDCIKMRGDETWMDYYHKALEGLCELRGKDTNVTTNADRIRSMNDDELADFMENFDKTGGCDTCSIRYQGKCNSISKCKDGYLGWLQSEVEE